ncbi:MAG: hypothetical protein JW924_03290 [Fusobacteriaceae bacterium]|nr:hypothetical protein [Fusobacteriaceae bacterium]
MDFKPNPIRLLAKTNKWQTLYYHSRENNGISLFDNLADLSHLQIAFIQWLEVYRTLYQDLAMGEFGIDEDIINDEIMVDAYLIYKERKDKKKKSKKDSREGIVFG